MGLPTEENTAYWIKRIGDKTITFTRPYADLRKDISDTIRHIDADPTEVNKRLDNIEIEFGKLMVAVEGLKPMTPKEKKINIIDTAIDTGEIQKGVDHGKV